MTAKVADLFEAHCTDALSLACEVGPGARVEPGTFVVVDDTYRPVRRKIHDTQPSKGNVRNKYSQGTVFGLRKGLRIGTPRGKTGRLCGEYKGHYRYLQESGKRSAVKKIAWISTQFITREGG